MTNPMQEALRVWLENNAPHEIVAEPFDGFEHELELYHDQGGWGGCDGSMEIKISYAYRSSSGVKFTEMSVPGVDLFSFVAELFRLKEREDRWTA